LFIIWQHSCNPTVTMKNSKSKAVILIVDDDEDILLLMGHKLTAEGYVPMLSPNGVNVMDIITHNHPDLVLLDIHMKGVDGGIICGEIKSNPETCSTPVIMFSANENIESITRNCGADGFLHKPFNATEFKKTFRQVLGNRQYE